MKNYLLPLIAMLCLTACSPKEQAKNDTPKTPVASTTVDIPKASTQANQLWQLLLLSQSI